MDTNVNVNTTMWSTWGVGRLGRLFTASRDFRVTIMSMLTPFDVAKFLLVTGCAVSREERRRHMNPIMDIVKDTTDLVELLQLGCRVVVVGEDLRLLAWRLVDPSGYVMRFGNGHVLRLMVMVFKMTCTVTLGVVWHPSSDTTVNVYPEWRWHTVPEWMRHNTGETTCARWLTLSDHLTTAVSLNRNMNVTTNFVMNVDDVMHRSLLSVSDFMFLLTWRSTGGPNTVIMEVVNAPSYRGTDTVTTTVPYEVAVEVADTEDTEGMWAYTNIVVNRAEWRGADKVTNVVVTLLSSPWD